MILLIDDEQIVRMITAELLDYLGYEVHLCSDGMEALDFYQENQDEIELVILDMVMPEMRGTVVFQKLKEMNPSVRVLFLSGFSHDHEVDEIMSLGALDYLKKPVSLEELGKKIKAALEAAPNL